MAGRDDDLVAIPTLRIDADRHGTARRHVLELVAAPGTGPLRRCRRAPHDLAVGGKAIAPLRIARRKARMIGFAVVAIIVTAIQAVMIAALIFAVMLSRTVAMALLVAGERRDQADRRNAGYGRCGRIAAAMTAIAVRRAVDRIIAAIIGDDADALVLRAVPPIVGEAILLGDAIAARL